MDTQFLYIHRLSLVAIGLWPYHRTMLVQLQSSVFSFMLISYIIVQLTAFITTEWTLDFIVEILSTLFFLLLCAVQYNCFWINTHAVKRILDNLQYICSELRDDNEIAIIKRYGHIAKCIANGLTLLGMCCLIIFTLVPILPRIFGILFLVNKSEPYRYIYMKTEYFIDQEKYFYFILLHLYAVQYIGGGTLLGSGIVLTGYFTYFCGLFNIASYRIKQAMQIINSDKICNWKNKRDIDKKISHAVDIHRTIIEFIEVSLYTFEGTYFLLIGLIVICLSLHLFGIFQAVCVVYNMADIVIHCSFAVGILVCSLGGNYVGQAVTDHYNDIFSTAYNIRWYITPVRVQRLILFLLQRGTKPYGIKLGGLYTLSLENFASLSTASISYFTIIYSLQK
ncbi:ObirOr5-9E79 [Ooceraea biroi]|uniref:Odorant receptor n=1 Tax=Ooceraea biroi TaxID=2015173 RepID=A0A026W8T1_OOCBI|nr:odorant receptor 13a isoform X2 [Ooceraea biroi]EZA52502.1 hypothetical protein X777_08609 [Ooceraea biroi]RLU25621.1 ObirOr5-9E79 [Ooceraea biroi]